MIRLLTDRTTLELLILEDAELGIPAPDKPVTDRNDAVRRAAMSGLIARGFLELRNKTWRLTDAGERELATIRRQALIAGRAAS